MSDWKSVLSADLTDWLLEDDNPSVRYFTLRDLLDKSEGDQAVIAAKRKIMETGPVPEIIGKQTSEGVWEDPRRFYTAKYTGTVWQLVVLAELGADGDHSRVRGACEFMLDNSQDPESGGFSMSTAIKKGGGRHSEVLPCLTGNMIWSLIRFGYLKDARVQRGVEWIVAYQRFDDGVDAPTKGWPYDKYEMCWGRHTCHMGVVKTLKALAEIPEGERSAAVKETIGKGAEFLLDHHIYKRSHDLGRVSKPGWKRFGFPLMYQTDALEILRVLTRLGCRDERMGEAIELLLAKRDRQGKWKLENTFNGQLQVDIERKGEASKWISLNALTVLKRYLGE